MTKRKNRSDESQCGAESEPILILDTTESDAGPAKRARLTAPDINSAKVDDKNDIVRQGKGDQLAQSMPLPQLTRSASEASARESDPGTGILGTAAAVTISGIGIYVAAKFLDWLTGSSDEQNNKPSAKGKQPPVAKPNMTATPPQKGAPSANGKQPPAAKPNTTTEPPRKNESSATHNQPAPGKSNTTAAPPPKGKSSAEVKQPAATTPNMTTDIPVSGPVPAENQSSKSRAEAPVVVSEAPQQASPRSTNGLGLSSKLLISESDVQIDESRKIGGGGFGEVYMGTLRNATRVAVKKVRGTLDTSAVQGFIREAQVWEGLGQRNVLRLLAFCVSPPMLITEMIDGGNLREYHSARGWNQEQGVDHLRDVAHGMAYLEAMKVVHGDLKSLNILIDGDRAVISDFGLSRIPSGTSSADETVTPRGTLAFMAPELFKGEPVRSPSDVYAFGMLCYEVTSKGHMPFEKVGREFIRDAVERGKRPSRPAGISNDLWKLMTECWDQEPQKRPTFVQVRERLDQVKRQASN